MKELVSIIIPCYNVEKYIERALKSLQQQTYKNIEIICVNDGSKDNTQKYLETYQKRHSVNIKIITTENGGVSAARNRGLDAAEGKYIMFLDADDFYSDRFVELMVNAVEKASADTAFAFWTTHKSELCIGAFEYTERLIQASAIASHFMYRPTPISFFSFIYKKTILEEFGIRFDVDLKYGEDNLFFWKYLCHIRSGVYLDCPLYWYYQNPSSAMHNVSWKIVDAIVSGQRAMAWMRKHNPELLTQYEEYSPARARFAIAKKFAAYGKKDLYQKFYKEYEVKRSMKTLLRKNGMKLSIAAFVVMHFPNAFYYVCRCSNIFRVRK